MDCSFLCGVVSDQSVVSREPTKFHWRAEWRGVGNGADNLTKVFRTTTSTTMLTTTFVHFGQQVISNLVPKPDEHAGTIVSQCRNDWCIVFSYR